MFDVDAANASLLHAYETAWPAITEVIEATDGASGAHLVRIPDTFADTPVRLAIIGQETKGWDRRGSAEAQRALYPADSFVEDKRRSPFWRATREVADTIGGRKDAPFLWANLVAADVKRKKAPPKVRNALRAAAPPHGLLRHILAAAQPNVAVFFTGPSGHYEWEMKQQFPGLEQTDVDGFDRRTLVRLHHEALPSVSLRSYHPGHLVRAKRWDVVAALAAEARRVLGTT